jgi:hypothetical protein
MLTFKNRSVNLEKLKFEILLREVDDVRIKIMEAGEVYIPDLFPAEQR